MTTERKRIESSNSHSSVKSKYRSLIQLRKDIGVIEGISIIIGVIVGSGIFVSPVGVLKYTNSVGLSLIVWVIAGVFSTVGALVWAELGATIPRSGGEYIYILKTFGQIPAFLCLWITFVLIGSVATAANSMIFAQYILQPFFTTCVVPHYGMMMMAVFGMLTLGAINCYNVQWATKMATVFTVCKVGAMLIIIGIGGYHFFLGTNDSFQDPFHDSNYNPGSLALGFYQGFWAYSGWNYLNFLTNEMKNPSRNLPMAIIISLVLVTIIYLLVNVAYLSVISPQEMLFIGQSSTAIAVNFADRTMGVMAWIMPVFVGISVLGSMNSELLSLSRLTHTGAEEKHMPAILAMVNYKLLTPMPAVMVITVFTIMFQMYQDAFYLIELTGFAFSVIAAMAVSSLLYLRYTHPELDRPFKLPIFVPIVFLLADIFIGCVTVHQQPFESLLSLLMMLVSIPIYLVFIAWKKKPKTMVALLIQATVCLQKLLKVVPQDILDDELDNALSKKSKKKQNGHIESNMLSSDTNGLPSYNNEHVTNHTEPSVTHRDV